MLDPELLERITARRAELDELEELLVKRLAGVRAERDEPAVAERVLERMTGQLADERAQAAPMPGQVGGRPVLLIPHRAPGVEEDALPVRLSVGARRAGQSPSRARAASVREPVTTAEPRLRLRSCSVSQSRPRRLSRNQDALRTARASGSRSPYRAPCTAAASSRARSSPVTS